LAIFPPGPVLGLKLADLDTQLNFVLNIHTLKADMSIAAEKLLLPSEDVRKKDTAPLPRWFSKKCSEFHCCECTGTRQSDSFSFRVFHLYTLKFCHIHALFQCSPKKCCRWRDEFYQKPVAAAVFFKNIESFFIFVCLDCLTKGPMPLFCEPD
jgi:hypothetical protein